MLTNNTLENLIEGVLRHGPKILEKCISDAEELAQYCNRIEKEFLHYPIPKTQCNKSKWLIPEDYCPNLVQMLYSMCETDVQRDRVSQELELYIKHGIFDLLHVMKYIVDTLRENNLVWGVGRGSSVSSYILFLIGIHKVDSLKYGLDINEFLR
jgi:DNA polymerase III alpha subunit